MTKIQILNDFIKKNKGDGMMLLSSINRFWLTNLDTSFGIIIINSKKQMVFITDSRYELVAKKTLKDADVWILDAKNTTKNLIDKAIKKLKIKKLLIEKEYLNLGHLDLLKDLNFIPIQSNWLRAIKTKQELKLLQASADIICKVIEWVWTWIKPGYTEKEIAKQISIKILELGGQKNSFDPIVAANKNGAKPHHKPSDYKIKDGDMVTIDLGCMYKNYASDMTRSFVVGKKCNNPQMLEIYEIVKQAQALGLKKCKPKTKASDIDLACRNYIDNTKYNGLFGHGTGHGVGLEVHEVPVVNKISNTILENNHVITIEPGIYLENVGGVRIEDTVVINNDKLINLTKKIPKDLKYIVNK